MKKDSNEGVPVRCKKCKYYTPNTKPKEWCPIYGRDAYKHSQNCGDTYNKDI